MSLKEWILNINIPRTRIAMMGIDLSSDKEKLIKLIKMLPDDIDIVIEKEKDMYCSPRYIYALSEINGKIIIHPSNEEEK